MIINKLLICGCVTTSDYVNTIKGFCVCVCWIVRHPTSTNKTHPKYGIPHLSVYKQIAKMIHSLFFIGLFYFDLKKASESPYRAWVLSLCLAPFFFVIRSSRPHTPRVSFHFVIDRFACNFLHFH